MKKLFSFLVLLIAMSTNVWAEGSPVITLSGAVVKNGEGFITLSIECNGVEVRDMQCDIILPIGYEFSEDARGKVKYRKYNHQDNAYNPAINEDDNATEKNSTGRSRRRVVFNSTTGALFNDGPYLDLYIKMTNAATQDLGETVDGTATGSNESSGDKKITISCQGGVTAHQDDTNFPITVVASILDEDTEGYDNDDNIPETAEGPVYLRRVIKAGMWNTICLPFDMSNELLTKYFGSDMKLANLGGITFKNNNQDMEVKFKSIKSPAIEANHPYLIKLGSEFTKTTWSFSIIDDVTVNAVDLPLFKAGDATFYGTYVLTSMTGRKATYYHPIYLQENNIYWLKNGKTLNLKGFRGWMEVKDISNCIDNNSNVNFFVDDDEIDGIDGITINKPVEGVYDLQGRKVNDEHLKKSIYIIDGKKVVVK